MKYCEAREDYSTWEALGQYADYFWLSALLLAGLAIRRVKWD